MVKLKKSSPKTLILATYDDLFLFLNTLVEAFEQRHKTFKYTLESRTSDVPLN